MDRSVWRLAPARNGARAPGGADAGRAGGHERWKAVHTRGRLPVAARVLTAVDAFDARPADRLPGDHADARRSGRDGPL